MSDSNDQSGFDSVALDLPAEDEASSSPDTVTVAGPSWFQRVFGAVLGAILALFLLPGSIALLAWNASRAVHTARSLAEGARVVIEATADRVDPGLDTKLVHVSGPLAVPGVLADPDFPVQAPNAAVLQRSVETYQWSEERRSGRDNTTTYSYSRIWSERTIDSSRFHTSAGHQNRPPRYGALTRVATEASLGTRKLTAPLLGSLRATEIITPSEPLRPGLVMEGEVLYVGTNAAAPQIGDQRIRWRIARPAEVSVIAAQQGEGFVPYRAQAGDALHMISPGVVPAGQMIHQAEQVNVILTWILRCVGVIVMFFGFCLMLGPLSALGSALPFVGEIIGAGIMLVGAVLTAVTAPLVIGLSWLVVRPVLGIAVLLGGAAMAYGLSRLVQARRQSRRGRLPPGPAAVAR